MEENYLLEDSIPKTIISPIDLNAGANTGGRFDMQKFKRVTFICVLAAGTTTTTHSIALKQHTVSTAGTPAALSVDNPYFHKIGAATSFTKVTPVAAADTYDLHSALADSASIVVFEVLQENLTDGYRYVSLDIADTGGAQLGSVIAIGHNATELPTYSKVV